MEHIPRYSRNWQPRTWCLLVWTVSKHAMNMFRGRAVLTQNEPKIIGFQDEHKGIPCHRILVRPSRGGSLCHKHFFSNFRTSCLWLPQRLCHRTRLIVCTSLNASNQKKKKISLFCSLLPNKEVHNECCISRRNHPYANSWKIGEYRIFVDILGRSRINWRVIARTDFHIEYSPIFSPTFVYSTNFKVPKMYSAHNDKYQECTNTLIRTLPVRLFSPNVLGYSKRMCGSAFR